jgi:uncharacterized protein YciI
MDSTRRLRVERRSARALVTNYIHELSERHNGAERPEASTDLAPSRLKESDQQLGSPLIARESSAPVARPRLASRTVKYVLFYVPADDLASKAPAHFPAHSARLDEFHSRGTLLMVGTFGNPQEEGAMAVFTTREAAEEFVRGDPFVLNGVMRDWQIREWDEVLAP